MFAIVEFGLLLNGWVAVSSTTREAARWASIGEPVQSVYDRVRQLPSPAGVDPGRQGFQVIYRSPTTTWTCDNGTPPATVLSVSCTGPGASDPSNFPNPLSSPQTPPPGSTVTVTINAFNYEVITPLIRPMFQCGGNVVHCYVPIESHFVMRYEGPPLP